jgi:hypothetical protein
VAILKPAPAAPPQERKTPVPNVPEARALVVGIAKYNHLRPLPPAVAEDVRRVKAILDDPRRSGYVQVDLVQDSDARRDQILEKLAELAAVPRTGTVFLYFSCHGGRTRSGNHYLLSVEAEYSKDDGEYRNAVSGPEFTAALRAIPARRVVVFLDCCYAAGIVSKDPGEPADPAEPQFTEVGLAPAFSQETFHSGSGRVLLSAARGDETAAILLGEPNSLFTTHLLEGLEGRAADANGYVRVFELFNYVQDKVRKRGRQRVIFTGTDVDEDFPVAFAGKRAEVPPAGASATPPAPPALAGGATAKSPFKEDVFVSFAPGDREWVRGTLLPRLEKAGLSIATGAQLPYGTFRVLALVQAVQECQRVLLVVSEESLQERVGKVVGALALTRTLQNGELPLVPVLRVDAGKLPLLYAALVGPDFSQGEDEETWEHLIENLRAPLPALDS